MRKLFILMMAMAFALCLPGQSNAEPGRWRRGHRAVRYAPVRQYSNQPGPLRQAFGNLMEIERKKNAWLAATFLGR